jgi:very-short-patch-repair endonuclease
MKRPEGEQPLERARELRRFSTEAEKRLWQALRSRRLAGFKFRRQVWLSGYVADFYCAEARLVVEADGGQHDGQREHDARRSAVLEREGFRVIRFWNHDVIDNLDGVLAGISQALTLPPPSGRRAPPSPQVGEGF